LSGTPVSSAQNVAVRVHHLERCGVLDVAHRASRREATMGGREAVEQRVERIVQQRLVARLAVVELAARRGLVVRRCGPVPQQLLDLLAQLCVAADYRIGQSAASVRRKISFGPRPGESRPI
jgi:hypothetical protein